MAITLTGLGSHTTGNRFWLGVKGAAVALAVLCPVLATAQVDEPTIVVDLAQAQDNLGNFQRVAGSVGTGIFGVPVSGGFDCDGDGVLDTAFSSMRASPAGRANAGLVYLIFGTGTIEGTIDTSTASQRVLEILGDTPGETTGDEIWMGDVTGDGIGDLLIGRQNFTPDGSRIAAGALSIVVGGAALRDLANELDPLDLRNAPSSVTVTTLVGAAAFNRLGIWMRIGDVTGDGVDDLVVGADQTSSDSERHHGAVYVVRGGSHLASGGSIDLAQFGQTTLAGHITRIDPPAGSSHHHFGATCQIADLDGNGRSEVLVAAALDRAGASLRAPGAPFSEAHGSGGAPGGWLYIAWDDNFESGAWDAGASFVVDDGPGSHSVIRGGTGNRRFGEEILGGLDYDHDGRADLFVGDITGDVSGLGRSNAGSGHVIYNAALLRGLNVRIDALPMALEATTLLGAAAGDISSDTAAHGDFDGDGIDDLAIASPHGTPLGRSQAGYVHILHGREGRWPQRVDLANLPSADLVRVSAVLGANGGRIGDRGDTLAYSAAAADLDGDDRSDLIINEMVGNGVAPNTIDVGNLVVIAGSQFARDDVEIAVRVSHRRRGQVFGDRVGSQRQMLVFVFGSESLDVDLVDIDSLRFGPNRARPIPDRFGRKHIEDFNQDGHDDLILRFSIAEVGLWRSEHCLIGLADGRTFRACGAVEINNRGGRGR